MKLGGMVGVLGIVIAVNVSGCRSPRPAQVPAAAIEHRDMLAAMERYLAAPLGSTAGDRERIKAFVVESHDVEIVIEAAAVPFLADELDPEAQGLLLVGFFAGNAAPQLRAGVRRDQLAAGVDGELAVYRALGASRWFEGRKVRSAGLDALLDLAQKGQLHAHLERMRAARPPADSTTMASARTVTSTRTATTAAEAAEAAEAGSGAADERSQRLERLVAEGVRLMQAGRAREAIADRFDPVIASLEEQYRSERRHIYCSHSPAEALLYMLQPTQKDEAAIVISPLWADTWFFKSYALSELGRPAEARAALKRALALSPHRAQYLVELGYHHQKAQEWRRSLDVYRTAEDAARFITDPTEQDVVHARAARGQGHALIELGDLDAAERQFQRSVALAPGQGNAEKSIEYIRALRQKGR